VVADFLRRLGADLINRFMANGTLVVLVRAEGVPENVMADGAVMDQAQEFVAQLQRPAEIPNEVESLGGGQADGVAVDSTAMARIVVARNVVAQCLERMRVETVRFLLENGLLVRDVRDLTSVLPEVVSDEEIIQQAQEFFARQQRPNGLAYAFDVNLTSGADSWSNVTFNSSSISAVPGTFDSSSNSAVPGTLNSSSNFAVAGTFNRSSNTAVAGTFNSSSNSAAAGTFNSLSSSASTECIIDYEPLHDRTPGTHEVQEIPSPPQQQYDAAAIANNDGNDNNRPLSAAAIPDRHDESDTSTQKKPRAKKRKTKRN
jgi:hypothetical protein